MDAVEILLLFVVGFSILVYLVLNNLDSLEKSTKDFNESKQSGETYQEEKKSVGASGETYPEDKKSVDADGEVEKQLLSENFTLAGFQEFAEGEEIEDLVNANGETSYFCDGISTASGNNNDSTCRNRGISDDDDHDNDDGGKGEEEFIDEWERIERTELEKIFGEAIAFVSCKNNADWIKDVKLQLYALQKIALEGPYHGSQLMTLNVSARSKWSSWQKLGNMSRELAMEKYIDILSEAVPKWKGKHTLNIEDAVTSEHLIFTRQDDNMELRLKD